MPLVSLDDACHPWAMLNLFFSFFFFTWRLWIRDNEVCQNPSFSDCPFWKHTKRSTPNVYVLYSLNTHNTSMVLPVEPEFEQVLLYSFYPLHVTLTLPSPSYRLLKSWKLVWDFSWKATRIIRRLLISYRFQSVSCSSVSYGKMIKVSLRSIADTVFRWEYIYAYHRLIWIDKLTHTYISTIPL